MIGLASSGSWPEQPLIGHWPWTNEIKLPETKRLVPSRWPSPQKLKSSLIPTCKARENLLWMPSFFCASSLHFLFLFGLLLPLLSWFSTQHTVGHHVFLLPHYRVTWPARDTPRGHSTKILRLSSMRMKLRFPTGPKASSVMRSAHGVFRRSFIFRSSSVCVLSDRYQLTTLGPLF